MSKSVLPVFSSGSFIVSGLTLMPLIHFESILFYYGIRECSNFILLHVAVQGFLFVLLSGKNMGRWEERGTLIGYVINLPPPLTPVHSQSCPALCDPLDVASGLFCPWDFPGKNTGADFSNCYSRGSSQLRDQTCIS